MKFNALLIALLLLAPVAGAGAATQLVDQVVAIVDDDIIMASELRERIIMLTKTLEARGVEVPAEDVLVRETLDRLILESVQLQLARRVGVRIADPQLDQAVARVAAQNNMSLAQFRDALEAEGESYANTRESIRREMTLQRVQSGNVNQRIQISEQEVSNFLATDEGGELTEESYRFIHALLPVAPDASDEEVAAAKRYVEQVRARVVAGSAFAEVVAETNSGYTFTGGDLGWRTRGDLPSIFGDVAPGMEQGDTSELIRSDSGFHLIHLFEKQGGPQLVPQTHVRHILIKPSEILTDEQSREFAAELKTRVEEGADFAELAREYSDDIGSAQEGGDLGWTMSGQMVPAFEAAMDATEPGEISDPIRSQFGWHVLEVLGRRQQDMSAQMAENKARDFIYKRKYQEELDAWLRKVRDEAFVDIK